MSSATTALPFSSFDENGISRISGMEAGPFPVGVTTVQFDDIRRADPGDKTRPRGLQTEIWYPASEAARSMPKNVYSNYLGAHGCLAGVDKAIRIANQSDVIGGYREGITIAELDDPSQSTWMNDAVRDAPIRTEEDGAGEKWPLVVFSHGAKAYRVSYLFWCEFLASHGFVVAACDHPGSARYTMVNGQVITPGGPRSERASIERERPLDVVTVINGMERLSRTDSRFAGRLDSNNVAVTGMSFGGYTTAAAIELRDDPRITAAVMQCPSLTCGKAGHPDRDPLYMSTRKNKKTPIMAMIGAEDTVIGKAGNNAAAAYVDSHHAPSYLFEIMRGGHVSFTSCEMYDPNYGNGISVSKTCKSLKDCWSTYQPLAIQQQHTMINSYGLAFLNTHMRGDSDKKYPGLAASIATYNESYLQTNHFGEELKYRLGKKVEKKVVVEKKETKK